LIGLGLAHSVGWINEAEQIEATLTASLNAPNDMYLMTRETAVSKTHCVRIKKIFQTGVEVMNPETGFEIWD
jgi:hypothetical protein